MIDLKKLKEHCDSYPEIIIKDCEYRRSCRKNGKCCKFMDSYSGECMLKDAPFRLELEKIEKIYNELFEGKK